MALKWTAFKKKGQTSLNLAYITKAPNYDIIKEIKKKNLDNLGSF